MVRPVGGGDDTPRDTTIVNNQGGEVVKSFEKLDMTKVNKAIEKALKPQGEMQKTDLAAKAAEILKNGGTLEELEAKLAKEKVRIEQQLKLDELLNEEKARTEIEQKKQIEADIKNNATKYQ